TRLLSCSVLHVGGERPVLLQGSMGGNYRGAIQLTNPSADRNPDMKVHPLDDLVGRTIGISRDRLIGGGALEEVVRIVNHADRAVTITVELDMGADDADIFEVRGRRAGRSCRWRSRPSGSRSATTGWTRSGAAPTSASRCRPPRWARSPRC